MKVGELKKFIEHLPDDEEICIQDDSHKTIWGITSVAKLLYSADDFSNVYEDVIVITAVDLIEDRYCISKSEWNGVKDNCMFHVIDEIYGSELTIDDLLEITETEGGEL